MVVGRPKIFHEADVNEIHQRLFPAEAFVWLDVPERPCELERVFGIDRVLLIGNRGEWLLLRLCHDLR